MIVAFHFQVTGIFSDSPFIIHLRTIGKNIILLFFIRKNRNQDIQIRFNL